MSTVPETDQTMGPSTGNGSSGSTSSCEVGKPLQLGELDASRLSYTFTSAPRSVPLPNSSEVWYQGNATDHMVMVKWSAKAGWETPDLVPYGPLSLMPTTSALHYATECFEGMKLYRGFDGTARLFRPDRNAARMFSSAQRVALPTFKQEELVKLIGALAAVDAPRWLPKDRAGDFLYVRPTLIATMPSLAVRKTDEALLFIIMCPFPRYDEPGGTLGPSAPSTGTSPDSSDQLASAVPAKPHKGVRLFASEGDTVRAWPGGFGNSKVGANYGPSLVASAAAAARGYDQILWLFGKEGWITEAGASNFFAVIRDHPAAGETKGRVQLITAPLEDEIILPGVTRLSVLEAARRYLTAGSDSLEPALEPVEVAERRLSIHELLAAADEGRLLESFACGTAFFIAPIGEIHYLDRDIDVPLTGANGLMGPYTHFLREHISAIMYGKVSHPWQYNIAETGFTPRLQ